MPANPGAKKAAEKQKKKREAAQRARQEAQARARARAQAQEAEASAQRDEEGAAPVADVDAPFGPTGRAILDFDELDRLSAAAATLIKKKAIDEATKVCAEIVRRFPGEPDGWQRFSAVYEARGDVPRALAEMERAKARASSEDAGTVAAIDKELRRLQALAAKSR